MGKRNSQTKQKKLSAAQHRACLREARDLINIEKEEAPSESSLRVHLGQHIPGVEIGHDRSSEAMLKAMLKAAKDETSKKIVNKAGKLVSRRASVNGKHQYEKGLMLWCDAVSKARKELDLKGFVPVGGQSDKGKLLYAKAKDIYSKRGAVMSSPVKTSRRMDGVFEEAKVQLQEQLPSMQKKMLEVLRDIAKEGNACNDPNQEALEKALAAALSELRLLNANASQGDDNMVDVASAATEPSGFGSGLRELSEAFARVNAEAISLKAQVQEQQQTIARLNDHCVNLENQLHQSNVSSTVALADFCASQDQRQQRMAEFLRGVGEAKLAQLSNAPPFNLKAVAEDIEQQRQQEINNFVRENFQEEAKKDAKKLADDVCALAAQELEEVRIMCEGTKKIAEESRTAIVSCAESVRSSSDLIANITATNAAQAYTLATQADTRFAAIFSSLTTAQICQAISAEVQKRERETREWCAKESYERVQGLAGLWQGAVKNYFQDPVAGGA